MQIFSISPVLLKILIYWNCHFWKKYGQDPKHSSEDRKTWRRAIWSKWRGEGKRWGKRREEMRYTGRGKEKRQIYKREMRKVGKRDIERGWESQGRYWREREESKRDMEGGEGNKERYGKKVREKELGEGKGKWEIRKEGGGGGLRKKYMYKKGVG